MNSQPGQPFSLVTLSGDRDAVLGYYLSHGFDQVRVEIKQDEGCCGSHEGKCLAECDGRAAGLYQSGAAVGH